MLVAWCMMIVAATDSAVVLQLTAAAVEHKMSRSHVPHRRLLLYNSLVSGPVRMDVRGRVQGSEDETIAAGSIVELLQSVRLRLHSRRTCHYTVRMNLNVWINSSRRKCEDNTFKIKYNFIFFLFNSNMYISRTKKC